MLHIEWKDDVASRSRRMFGTYYRGSECGEGVGWLVHVNVNVNVAACTPNR